MSKAISVQNVSKKYGANEVLKNINIDIEDSELVCLLGPSGCGKTTLLRLIAGLDNPSSGSVLIGGKDATFLPPGKRNYGIMFQSYALFPNLTAYDNIAYGLKNRKVRQKEIGETVDRLLDMVGLADAHARYPSQLSGGEQQRVALARALAINPSFLLLDEPLSALDAKVRIKLRREICRIQKELKLTTIMVTHDQEEALTMADRIIVMNKAEVMQTGTPEEIYQFPCNKFVADFIGAINFHEASEKVIQAVRPENVEVSLDYRQNALKTTLMNIEFRGNFCRLYVVHDTIAKNAEYIADIPLSRVKEMELTAGKAVYLCFPENQTVHIKI